MVLDNGTVGGWREDYMELFNPRMRAFQMQKSRFGERRNNFRHRSSRIRMLASRDPDFSSGPALRQAKIFNFWHPDSSSPTTLSLMSAKRRHSCSKVVYSKGPLCVVHWFPQS